VKDLAKYLGNKNFFIIGDKLSVKLNKASYPMDANTSFMLTYEGKNEKVSKKIPFTGHMLTIAKELIVSDQGDLEKGSILKTVKLFKFDNSTNQSALITSFSLVFLDAEKIAQEFDVIAPILKDQNMARFDAVEYLKGYFNDVYGQSDPDMLYLTVNKEINKFYKP
jgi:hypothetical protein